MLNYGMHTLHLVITRALRMLALASTLGISVRSIVAQTTMSSGARGTLYIVGGGPQPPALVREFVDLAGGAGKAHIVVFAMASADGLKGGEAKAKELRALGADAVSLWVQHADANADSVVNAMRTATGIWFVGGYQNKLMAALGTSRTATAIRERYQVGAVIGGTSAGAAVMSAVMLTGDERRPGGARPDSTLTLSTIDRDNVVVAPGFGLIDNAIVDQHFLRRRRANRLISLVLEREPHLGIGIDESTALVVEPNGSWRIAGASVAVVYDARQSTTTPNTAPLGATGVVMHVLPAGSRFNPKTGVAMLPMLH